jgi:predicted O-methyltransferase YrrM
MEIESLRSDHLKNNQVVEINDLGAGSRVQNSNRRKISQITKYSSTPPRFSSFISRLIREMKSKTIIELGTSLGFNTLYMSQANPDGKIFTFEGCDEIAALAQKNFDQLESKNIELIKGNIDLTLSDFLSKKRTIDLAYIDANHRYEPTITYFNQILTCSDKNSIIVIDDIHWSKEMNNAWKKIKKHNKVSVSIDLFEAGIVFLNPELPKTDFVLKF